MSTFRDALGRDWTIEFDALMLGALRDQHKIDLLDVGGGGYTLIENDEEKLTLTLLVVCREQIEALKLTPQQFARGLSGDAYTRAYQAVVAGAANFFPGKKWSAILSCCKQQRQISDSWAAIRPMLRMLNDPDMPQQMLDSVMLAITAKLGEIVSTDLRSSAVGGSAPGPAATPSSTATDSPASAESPPAA